MYSAKMKDDFVQGDVFTDITASDEGKTQANIPGLFISASLKIELAVIISHDCDSTKRNAGKRPYIVFSMLEPVSPQRLEFLKKDVGISKLGDLNELDISKVTAANLFYFEPLPDPFHFDYVVDFDKTFSVNRKRIEIKNKIAQLDSVAKEKFTNKLVLNFGRP